MKQLSHNHRTFFTSISKVLGSVSHFNQNSDKERGTNSSRYSPYKQLHHQIDTKLLIKSVHWIQAEECNSLIFKLFFIVFNTPAPSISLEKSDIPYYSSIFMTKFCNFIRIHIKGVAKV